jgi:hypothetical protein
MSPTPGVNDMITVSDRFLKSNVTINLTSFWHILLYVESKLPIFCAVIFGENILCKKSLLPFNPF